MSVLTVSSRGQVVLPAAIRRRLGMGAGATLEASEVADGLLLSVVRGVQSTDVSTLAGMVKAPKRGVARRLQDFDPATLMAQKKCSKR
jgi:antitoxin PrlF